MDKLIKLLEEIKSDVDYYNCEDLIDGGIFGSFEIIQTITEIEEKFGISIPPEEIRPANLNSAVAIWNMVQRLQ